MKQLQCISSPENERYKLAKALTKGHGRKKYGLFIVETPVLVLDVLKGGWHIEWVALTPHFAETPKGMEIIELARERAIDVTLMKEKLMDEISTVESGGSVIAVVKQRRQSLSDIQLKERDCVFVLEDVQDPTNVGAITRIADAVGASAVIATVGTADRYNPKVLRSSAGSALHVAFVKVVSMGELHRWLEENEFEVVATDPHNGECCYSHRFSERVAFLFGNEAKGLSESMRSIADLTLTIPMHGGAESLNVSHACAILAYELLRQWYYSHETADIKRRSDQPNGGE